MPGAFPRMGVTHPPLSDIPSALMNVTVETEICFQRACLPQTNVFSTNRLSVFFFFDQLIDYIR